MKMHITHIEVLDDGDNVLVSGTVDVEEWLHAKVGKGDAVKLSRTK